MNDPTLDMSDPPLGMPPAAGRFERWAARLFGALLVLIGFALVIGLANRGDVPLGAVVLALAATPLGVVALLGAIWGLGESRSWSRPLALAMLWILIAGGVVQIVMKLPTIHFPLEAIAAVFVLRTAADARQSQPLTGRDRRIAFALTGLFLLSTAWPLVSSAALRPGASQFAVGPDALNLSVSADCSDASGSAGVLATVRWKWRDRDLLPGSTDGLFVGWRANIDEEAPSYDQEASVLPIGVWPGSGSPATSLIQPLEGSWDGQSTTFGIDVARAGQADGEVIVVLRPLSGHPHGSVVISATYVHLDRWERDAEGRACSW